MRRKNISTGGNNAAAIIELDENEDLVEEVTTTKRVGRQRRADRVDDPPLPVAGDIIDAEAEGDDEADDETPEFSDTSLAALIYSGGEERVENQYCTIAIRRNPDSMNDRFLTPCGSNTSLPPLRNVELAADRMDIEERVRSEFGGGHYFFQIHFDNRLRSSWRATLSDDPVAVHAARLAKDTALHPAAAAAAPSANPIDDFLNTLEKQKRLQDLLFGDDRRRMEAEIAQLRAANAAAKAEPSEPKSEKLALLELALAAPKAEVTDRLLNSIFPSDDEGSRHWSADVFAVALENKDLLLGLAGSLLGPLFGGGIPQPAQPAPSFEDMMRSQPPGGTPTPSVIAAGPFRRNRIAEPAADEDPPTFLPLDDPNEFTMPSAAGNAGDSPAHDEAAEVVAADDIDTSTDAAAIDAEEDASEPETAVPGFEPDLTASPAKTRRRSAAK